LRTPLTSIRAFTEILSDDHGAVSEEERRNFMGIIAKESERLTRLIDQILDLAKMEAGQLDWSMERISLHGAVDEALASVNGLIKEKSIRLDLEIPPRLPMIRADRDRLVQVVINLLSNAVKFCRDPDGLIQVRAAPVADGLLVSIADNGDGVLPEDRDRVFEKFHQINHSSPTQPVGTGLGLAICRQIVTFFGGDIWVDTREGGGASFSFTLPYDQVEEVMGQGRVAN